ncbi:hypothetical protein [Bradyrhizobium sp. B117]
MASNVWSSACTGGNPAAAGGVCVAGQSAAILSGRMPRPLRLVYA